MRITYDFPVWCLWLFTNAIENARFFNFLLFLTVEIALKVGECTDAYLLRRVIGEKGEKLLNEKRVCVFSSSLSRSFLPLHATFGGDFLILTSGRWVRVIYSDRKYQTGRGLDFGSRSAKTWLGWLGHRVGDEGEVWKSKETLFLPVFALPIQPRFEFQSSEFAVALVFPISQISRIEIRTQKRTEGARKRENWKFWNAFSYCNFLFTIRFPSAERWLIGADFDEFSGISRLSSDEGEDSFFGRHNK